MGVLAKLAGWKGYAAAGALAAVLSVSATLTVDSWRYGARISDLVASNARVMQSYSDRAYAAEQAQRTEETRREAEKEALTNEARTQLAAAQAAATRAAVQRDSLRQQLAAYVASSRSASQDPAAVGRSPDARDPLDLLSELFSRADDRAGELAAYADVLRVAGDACNRQYESLTP